MLGKKVLSDNYVTKLYEIFKSKEWTLQENAVTRKKAITDVYPEEEAKQKMDIMKKISTYLHAPRGMQLGYADTESLVAMMKTPNNTFPVYWYEHKNNTYAPFVRKGNVKVIRS